MVSIEAETLRGIEISKAQPVTHRSNICSLSFCSQVVLNVFQFLVRRYLIDYDRHDPLFSHLWISRNRMFERRTSGALSTPIYPSRNPKYSSMQNTDSADNMTITKTFISSEFSNSVFEIFLPLFLSFCLSQYCERRAWRDVLCLKYIYRIFLNDSTGKLHLTSFN